MDDWSYDGWAQACPVDSPLRRVPSIDDRLASGKIWTPPKQPSLVKDAEPAMDMCLHPDRQLIHGFTSWPGPRSGFLCVSSLLFSPLLFLSH
jgi:hypothetical protein